MPIAVKFNAPILLLLTLCTILGPASIAGAANSISAIDGAPSHRVLLTPGIVEVEATPGSKTREKLTIRNETENAIELEFSVASLESSRDPEQLAKIGSPEQSILVEHTGWINPTANKVRLDAMHELTTDITIAIPSDASPGDRAVALLASWQPANTQDQNPSGANVSTIHSLAAQFILQTPGDIKHSLKVLKTSSPRFAFPSDRVTITARLENDGDGALLLDGQVAMRSGMGSGRLIETDDTIVLPNGVRELHFNWNDRPLIGRFVPQLTLVGGAGSNVRIETPLKAIWVLPPWWLIVGIVLAIGLGVTTHIKLRPRRALKSEHRQHKAAERYARRKSRRAEKNAKRAKRFEDRHKR